MGRGNAEWKATSGKLALGRPLQNGSPKEGLKTGGNGKAKIKTGDRDGGAQTAGGIPRARMELMRPGAHHSLGVNTRVVKAHCKVKPKTGWEAKVWGTEAH